MSDSYFMTSINARRRMEGIHLVDVDENFFAAS